MFKYRSHKKELLDEHDIPVEELRLNLRELHVINRRLGGYGASVSALKKVISNRTGVTIVDIGCGGGDTLKTIYRKVRRHPGFRLYGIDIKAACIDYCKNNDPHPEIDFIADDYLNVCKHVPRIDVLHAALFCHHLTEQEIVRLLRFALDHKSVLVINDLERNSIAYYAIRTLTRLFSKSRLVKHDAPLSVLRGFKRSEWKNMIAEAGAKKFTINNRWAFRHQVIVYE
jgi:2-polyprenyl-3-methyl-5-hydroxy-6-metoxy-1,4-benzoquinol methylase